MKRLLVCVIIISMFAFFVLTGCSQNKDENPKLRIGYFPNVNHAQALVGIQSGIFVNNLSNVDVEFIAFNAGSSVVEAMFSNNIDIAYLGPIPFINGHIKSRGDIIGIAGSAIGGSVLVALKDSNIKSIADLDGKRISIPQIGNTQHIALLDLLSKEGLKDTFRGGSVEILPVINPYVRDLLDSRDIDAAFLPEPWASELIEDGRYRVVLNEYEVFGGEEYSSAIVVVRKSYLASNKDIVERFLLAHIELTEMLIMDESLSKTLITQEIEKITGKKVDQNILDSTFRRTSFDICPIMKSIEEFAEIFYQQGFTTTKIDVNALFDLDIIERLSN